ncbi:glycosyltransferase family 4 protein [Nocardioides sp. GCM10027113]|uniref:glycosyltransferase family 4 protein n=1 Tax=unclassified Nocardioides TaxID=2615069 RepID=UPI00360947CB
MRILAIHRYYWPDSPPYASLLRAIVAEWSSAGHDVTVLAGQPSYKVEARQSRAASVEKVDGATVRRVRMRPDRTSRLRRLFNVGWFPVAVAVRVLLSRRQDVVMCSTVPPVLLGWAVSLVARVRGSKFVYHCMDLHPEIGRLSGDFSNATLYRLLARLELATCRRASAIVVLSEDMRLAVLRRDPALADKLVVLTNFELPDFSEDSAESPLPASRSSALRIVFTGNIGRFQGLQEITRAVVESEAGLELVLMGEGAAKAELQELVSRAPDKARSRVTFLAHGTSAEARALMETADLGLVSLSPSVIQYAFPSKTATYLGCGLPVLVAVEPSSSLAQLVTRNRVGWVVPVGDPSRARETLDAIVARRSDLSTMSRHAVDLWRDEFSADALLPRWRVLLDELDSGKPSATSERGAA